MTQQTRQYRSWTSSLGRLGRLAGAGVAVLVGLAGESRAVDYRVRWQPSPTTGVTSYNVYVGTGDAAYGPPRDAALPAVATDGSMSYVVTALQAGVGYRFAVSAVRTGVESALSNEIRLCGSGADCDDGRPCTSDVCSAGVCDNPPGNDGASCADGNVCNGAEVCSNGTCQSSGTLNCNDNNSCTIDGCDAQDGCTHTLISGCQGCTSSGTCSDGNPCNGAETCVSGFCRAGTLLPCNDGNACTTDTCSSQAGCVNAPIAGCQPCATNAQCDDGNACDGVEVCTTGRCRNDANFTCDDGDPCTADACAAATGCTHELQDTCYACELRQQATLYAKRITVKRSGLGVHFRAVGLLEPTAAVDPLTSGLVFDIRRPSTGELFYRGIVPGSALVTGVLGKTLRLPLGTDLPSAPGLKMLRIRLLSTGRLFVAVFGRAQRMPSSYPVDVGWTLMLGDQCGSDRCTAYAQSSDCR